MHTFTSCSIVEVSGESLDTAPFKGSHVPVPDEKSMCNIDGKHWERTWGLCDETPTTARAVAWRFASFSETCW
jgi:hypothetical protein